MRKALSFQTQLDSSPVKQIFKSKFSYNSLKSSSHVTLQNYLKTRNTSTIEYSSKEQQHPKQIEQHTQLAMKQRSITKLGNLISQQLEKRKKATEKISLNQMRRQQILMQEILKAFQRLNANNKEQQQQHSSSSFSSQKSFSDSSDVMPNLPIFGGMQVAQSNVYQRHQQITVEPDPQPIKDNKQQQMATIRARRFTLMPQLDMNLINQTQ